jgi:hypothetical protein
VERSDAQLVAVGVFLADSEDTAQKNSTVLLLTARL